MRRRRPSFALAVAALLAAVSYGGAQQPAPEGMPLELRSRLEFRPVLGGLVATGAQRRTFEDAALIGIHLAAEVRRNFHVVGAFSYIPSHTRRADGGYDGVRMFQWDLGAEVNSRLRVRRYWTPRPFVGAGVGRRTYENSRRELRHGYPTVYGGFGIEYQTDVIGVRVEARDYVSRFAGFDGMEPRGVRNDIALALAIAYHVR